MSRSRLLAVGASNLARLALALLDAERARTGGAVTMHAALGRGRSLGLASRLLGRGLDSILASPLWRETGDADAATTTAVLMDVGNDLLYGVDVPRILGWVDATLQQLRARASRLAVVGQPIAAIRTLSTWRFTLVRSVLVPSCRLTLRQTLDGAEHLHAELARMAEAVGATFHAPPAHWYGFDPVHVRSRHAGTAAATWLGAPASPGSKPLDTAWQRMRLMLAAPASRRWFGRTVRRRQPSRRFGDGSSLSLW